MSEGARPVRATLRAIAMSAVLPTALGLVEVIRRHGGDPLRGAVLAVCLGVAIGGAIGLAAQAIGRRRLPMIALHLLVPLAFYGQVIWAVGRFADLSKLAVTLGIWTAALAVPAPLAWLAYRLVARTPMGRVVRVTAAATAFLAGAAVLLDALQPYRHEVARIVTHGYLALFAALALWPRVERFTLPLAALAGAAALQVVPVRYLELILIFGSLSLTTSVAALRVWGVIPDSKPGARGLACGAALVLASAASAHMLVKHEPSSWATARGQGFLTALISAGHRFTDFDGDHHGAIFAQADCSPFDGHVFPGQHEVPGNAVDENCNGRAAPASSAAWVRAQESLNPLPPQYRGDIVIVLVDTLRRDTALDPSMTAFSSFARDGLSFTRAYSESSFTAFSLTALLGGKMASSVEMKWFGKLAGMPVEPVGGLVPALRRLGYDTAVAGVALLEETPFFASFAEGFRVQRLQSMHARPEPVAQAAIEAWDSLATSGPRFLYVHFMWVHESEEGGPQNYLEHAQAVDRSLGALRARIGDGPLWIVTADHGSEFHEHGGEFHASTLYEEVVHVPLFMLLPGAAPRVIDQVSPQRFLGPTLRAMVDPSHAARAPGPYLCIAPGACNDLPATMALELQDIHLHALLLGRSKIIHDLTRQTFTAFDLARDPGEQHPLEPLPAELKTALETWEDNLYGATDPAYVWPYQAQ